MDCPHGTYWSSMRTWWWTRATLKSRVRRLDGCQCMLRRRMWEDAVDLDSTGWKAFKWSMEATSKSSSRQRSVILRLPLIREWSKRRSLRWTGSSTRGPRSWARRTSHSTRLPGQSCGRSRHLPRQVSSGHRRRRSNDGGETASGCPRTPTRMPTWWLTRVGPGDCCPMSSWGWWATPAHIWPWSQSSPTTKKAIWLGTPSVPLLWPDSWPGWRWMTSGQGRSLTKAIWESWRSLEDQVGREQQPWRTRFGQGPRAGQGVVAMRRRVLPPADLPLKAKLDPQNRLTDEELLAYMLTRQAVQKGCDIRVDLNPAILLWHYVPTLHRPRKLAMESPPLLSVEERGPTYQCVGGHRHPWLGTKIGPWTKAPWNEIDPFGRQHCFTLGHCKGP